MILRPRTAEAYVEMVKQAVFKVEDMRAVIENDAKGLPGSVSFVDELEKHIKDLYKSLQDGTYEYQDKDLPFIEIARQYGTFTLPFRDLLHVINKTHRSGLDMNGEDGVGLNVDQ